MVKKIRAILMTVIIVFSTMICCSLNAFALTDGDWEFQLLDSEVKITKYIGDDTNVVIPEMILGCPVTSFGYGDKVFNGNKKITSIEFKPKIKEFPDALCFELPNLETVTLHEGVETIGSAAFWHCVNLKNINIPSTVKHIQADVFCGCKSLTSVTLPDGIESIGGRCFESSGITEIDLSNVKTGYNTNAIKDTFAWCEKLESVKLSASVAIIPERMFIGCTALKNVEIPSGVTEIEKRAFDSCKSLENIILPSTLKTIGNAAFASTALKEIVIPYGTETIYGTNATFGNCKNLEAIYVPETVKKIYLDIVINCPKAIVYCSADSYVANYCKERSISYLTDNSVNSGIHVYYNGERISFHSYGQNPEILDGRTLVPLRSIFEAMGADVEWDGTTSTAIAKRGNIEVKITIGANEIYKNGKAIAIDVPAQLMNDRTMVPARVIAEAFGADVQWNGNGRAVLISESH